MVPLLAKIEDSCGWDIAATMIGEKNGVRGT